VLAGAAASDALDGSLARRARARAAAKGLRASTSGEWLDPLADKVFVLAAIAAIVAHAPRTLPLVALACTRELALVPLAAVYRLAARDPIAHVYRADRIGKATTIAQFVTLAGLVVHARWAPVTAVLAGALGLAAVAHYVRRTARRGRLSSTAAA
jgi:phosphatidylglycerophosphate synthase